RARRRARAGVPSPRGRTGRAGDPGGRRGRPRLAGGPGEVRPRARSLTLHADYYQVPRREDGRGDAARGGAAVSKLRVGILGATGTVGQRFVQMLERHPLFTVSALAASDRSQGKPYADACAWKLAGEMPRAVRDLPVRPPRPPLDCDVVFSSLPADVGREAEGCFAAEGYPGVSALDITDNVLPFIANEEEKIERETQKILGSLRDGAVEPAPFPVSAQCHRVNVQDGHMAAVRVKLARKAALAEVREALASFRGAPQELGLHTAPERPIVVRDEPDRPQPRLDRDAGNGMSVTVGRLLPDSVLDYRFVALSHNTIRGAAGAAILNAELLVARGYLKA